MLKGLDVSKWQGDINWDSLKPTVDFAIIRSSYGTGYTDIKFTRNRDEVRRVGLPHGFYHYAYPTYNTPEAEANYFADVIGTPQDGEFLCLDFEEAYGDPVGWSKRFLDTLSNRLGGYKPLIYMNLNLATTKDWQSVVNGNYGLWLARWDYSSTAPAPNTKWPFTAFRQYSNKETFAGISGGVDADIFYGSKDALHKYGYQVAVTPPTPPPVTPPIPTDDKDAKINALLEQIDQLNKNMETAIAEDTKNQETLKETYNTLNALQVKYDALLADYTVKSERLSQLETTTSTIPVCDYTDETLLEKTNFWQLVGLAFKKLFKDKEMK